MKFRVLPLFFLLAPGLFLIQATDAAVVFRPGEKAKYVAPGEEELNGNAAELFEIGQKAEKEGMVLARDEFRGNRDPLTRLGRAAVA